MLKKLMARCMVIYFYIAKSYFFVYIKTDNIYKDTAKDVQTRFDTLNYKLDRSLPKRKK